VLKLEQAEQTFVFTGVPVRPVPSLLRDFSAPVKMAVEGQSTEDLIFLFAHDSDPFNRRAHAPCRRPFAPGQCLPSA
jgi:aminopeptidase N